MESLLSSVRELRNTETGSVISSKIREFKRLGKKSGQEIFKELSFCILTANFTAERGIKIQKEIGDGFLNLSEKELAKKLRELGYRFPNTRAHYIVESRKYADSIKEKINSFKDKQELRDWLVKNIKGFGYKEASHFLRNIGLEDFAIIDFHIIDILTRHELIKKPKTLTKAKYIEIEEVLRKIAKKLNLSLGELDLYLWYLETGKVLK